MAVDWAAGGGRVGPGSVVPRDQIHAIWRRHRRRKLRVQGQGVLLDTPSWTHRSVLMAVKVPRRRERTIERERVNSKEGWVTRAVDIQRE